jgi:hypothetical protein
MRLHAMKQIALGFHIAPKIAKRSAGKNGSRLGKFQQAAARIAGKISGYINFFTARTALSPPKANEFDSAASIAMARALLGT